MKRILCVATLMALLFFSPLAVCEEALMWTEDGYRILAINEEREGLLLSELREEVDGFVQVTGIRLLFMPPEGEGAVRWKELSGGSGTEMLFQAIPTEDGWIAVGTTSSGDLGMAWHEGWYEHGEAKTDGWVIRVDREGEIIWQRNFGGSDWDILSAICPAHDGGWIVTGNTYSSDGDIKGWHDSGELYRQPDGWMLHLDEEGEIRWQLVLGGSGADSLVGVKAVEGGYLAVGSTDSDDGDVAGGYGDQDGWVVIVDAGGALVSQQCLGGASEDGFEYVAQGPDGCLAVGATWSDEMGNQARTNAGWAVLLDDAGQALWSMRFGNDQGMQHSRYAVWSDDFWAAAGMTYAREGDVEWIVGIRRDGREYKLVRGEL